MFLIENMRQDEKIKKYMDQYAILKFFVSRLLQELELEKLGKKCDSSVIRIDEYKETRLETINDDNDNKSFHYTPVELFIKFSIIGVYSQYLGGIIKLKVREREINFQEIQESILYAETIGDIDIELNLIDDYTIKFLLVMGKRYFQCSYQCDIFAKVGYIDNPIRL